MKLLFSLLLIAGAVYAAIYYQVLPGVGTSMGNLLSLDKVPERVLHPFDKLAPIRDLERKILVPLNSSEGLTREEAQARLAELKENFAGQATDNADLRAKQALALLQQALQERASYLARAKVGTATNDLDKVPGKWHPVGQKDVTVDVTEMSHQERASFWAQAAIAGWKQREEYYRQTIGRLLAANAGQ